MTTLLILIGVACGFFVVERLWPANRLPAARGWWARVGLVNLVQLGIVILAGQTWDRWMQRWSLLHLSETLGDVPAAVVAYVVSCVVYYWWHRVRHESPWFWRLCHQLHHSPRRIELVTSFYKHPVEITINSLLSSGIVFLLLGCSLRAAALYTLAIAVAEYFYHWNVRTPRWLGWFIQRPESHRVHHEHQRHTSNYADPPVIDWLFGTLENPERHVERCGFDRRREARVAEMLAFRDVHQSQATSYAGLAPTCLGCRKRWACQAARASAVAPKSTS
jgi:sterol desaturase/sphingolipid hydroxylase (fatty acid hydroxylase superfamily)